MSVTTAAPHPVRTRAGSVATPGRLAGTGGLVFVVALVIQNALRAASPGFGAAPAKVTDYFLHHRVAALVPLGMFPIEMLGLFAFVAGVWAASANRSESRWWATLGGLGAASIASLFALVNIIEIVIAAKAESLASSPVVVEALWAIHAAAFGLDMAATAVALIGLSRAAAAFALIPRWISAAALPGAGCSLVAATFAVAITNGGAWFALGLVGFVTWIVFTGAASISLLRKPQMP
jgi:hypothetical protein